MLRLNPTEYMVVTKRLVLPVRFHNAIKEAFMATTRPPGKTANDDLLLSASDNRVVVLNDWIECSNDMFERVERDRNIKKGKVQMVMTNKADEFLKKMESVGVQGAIIYKNSEGVIISYEKALEKAKRKASEALKQ